jgi:hypothetical protein
MSLRLPLLLLLVLTSPLSLSATFDWSDFDAVLKSNVKAGSYQKIDANLVDYTALLRNKKFTAIGQQLADYDPNSLQGDDKLAFYINAYNYFAIKIILDHWPVESIKDIGSLFKPVWKRGVGSINGKIVTLNEIEHEVLRPLGDPRIHFAIVCASMSCPDLRMEVFTAEELDHQLNEQTQTFLANSSKGAAVKKDELYLSEIFDWFEQDFEAQGGIYQFIGRFHPQLQQYSDFEMIDYNWQLNSQRPKSSR